ncbi:hypothetical protein DV737_g5704, partial [Chaetothyriales sp. CBS 132003]
MSTHTSKRQQTDADQPYELIYWPSIPGRGEFIRLAFEATNTPYNDTAQIKDGLNSVLTQISEKNTGDGDNPPPFSPPILKHGDLVISQTPNILLYLGPKLGLVPESGKDPNGTFVVNELALTILDGLSNEPHDTHHPIASGDYYEDQKDEALRKAKDYREVRLPKFLAYFERVLSSTASNGGEYLYHGSLTYADLVLFQSLDGVQHAFPKQVKALREGGKYEKVWALYERVKGLERVKAYLESDRRQKYGLGLYRYYPELDAK